MTFTVGVVYFSFNDQCGTGRFTICVHFVDLFRLFTGVANRAFGIILGGFRVLRGLVVSALRCVVTDLQVFYLGFVDLVGRANYREGCFPCLSGLQGLYGGFVG